MKKKLAVIVSVVTLIVIAAVIIAVTSGSPDNDITEEADNTTQSVPESSDTTQKEDASINLTPDTVSCIVYAPKHSTVLFDNTEMPYIENSKNYRLFTQAKGKHTVTVSKYGYHTVTKEIDFDEQKSAEIHVDLNVTEEYKKEIEKVAGEALLQFIEICADGSGDLSGFKFNSDKDRVAVQKVADDIINELDVDTDEYKTGKITVLNLSCDGFDKNSETLSWSNGVEGSIVNFTVEYTYTWEYNGEYYQDSGVDSSIANPFIMMENVDGEWYLKSVFLMMRKSLH